MIKLTLLCSLGEKKNNPLSYLIENSKMLKKYGRNQVIDFIDNPDLPCFQKDVLELTCVAYNSNIIILSLDSDKYLNELLLTPSKLTQKTLMLAKINNRFFPVIKTQTYQIISEIKQFLYGQIVNKIFSETEEDKQNLIESCSSQQYISNNGNNAEKIHFNADNDHNIFNNKRKHKKSLSEGGGQFIQQLNLNDFKQQMDSSQSLQKDPSDLQVDMGYYSYQYPMHASDPNYMAKYYPSYYQSYVMGDNSYGYQFQPTCPINNQRYEGRLKFFDQNGNYGFIVIDNLNIDVFVHFDDLSKAGINKERLLAMKNGELRFAFVYYQYEGKFNKKSKKAIDLKLIE